MTKRELLIEKMENEFQAYISELLEKPPEEILKSAYEKVIKEDILYGLHENELSEKMANYLLSHDYPLDALYQNWLKVETSYMEELMAIVETYAAAGLMREKKRER